MDRYAGLGPRILAFAVDYLLIAAYLAVVTAVGALVARAMPPVTRWLFANPLRGQAAGFLLVTIPVTLYFGLSEASPWQASVGKRRLCLQVTLPNGTRLSLARSLGRTALKFIPWELAHTCVWQLASAPEGSATLFEAGLLLVWVLVGANVISLLADAQRRTLYDRVAGTLVRFGPSQATAKPHRGTRNPS